MADPDHVWRRNRNARPNACSRTPAVASALWVLRMPMFGWFVVLAAAAMAWPTHAAEPRHSPLNTYASAHYVIHTDIPRDEVRRFATHMDAVFRAFERRFAGFESRDRDPMPVYLFQAEAGYHAFLATQQINAANSSGMFFTGPTGRGLAVYVEGQPRSKVFATLQHEGFHQFAYDYLGRDVPIWLNEGLAQYFETGVIVGSELRTGMTDSFALEAVQNALRQGKAVPFDELLADTPATWHTRLSKDPDRARLAYAQSWSMAYFLVHANEGRYRPPLDDYLHRLSKGAPPTATFAEVFGSDIVAFERVWRRYTLTLKPDPVNAATDRMTFLAQSLLFLAGNDYPLPGDLDDLETTLRRLQYRATWRMNGLERQYAGTDRWMFSYHLPNGASSRFRLLEPARGDLPPRITAPGLIPEPTVVWSRGPQGSLVSDIVYR